MEKTFDEIRILMDQFTESLAALVEGVQVVIRDEVAELLSQYNDLVPECNERLQHCAGLLGRGLRDEALGYASDEPGLLVVVDVLDIASRPQWADWLNALQSLGFPQPAGLKVDFASDLRNAEDVRGKLKPLVDQWRRANLANAPLASRINTLRQLRKADPNNESWFECLRSHEKQRAMEIESDVRKAFAAKDESQLVTLDAEFKAEWLEVPPARVRKAVGTALASIRGARVNDELKEAVGALICAFDAKDVDTARTWRAKWTALADERGAFADDDELLSKAVPILDWTQRHDRLEALFAEVWQLLDARPATRNAVREWVRSLARMRDEVEDLAEKLRDEIDMEPIERLRSRVSRIEDDQRREQAGRRRLMYLTVGAAAAVAVGVIATATSISRHNDGVRRAVAEVDGLIQKIEAGSLSPERAPELAFADWLLADPVVNARVSRLKSAIDAENQRRQQLDASLQKLSESLDKLSAAPKAQSIAAWPEPFIVASKLVSDLKNGGLAKTSDDKANVTRAEGRLENASKRLQRDADDILSTQVRALEGRLEALRAQAKGRATEVVAALEQIEKDIAELREVANESASPTASGNYARMTKASAAAARPLQATGSLVAAVAEIRKSVDEWQRLRAAEKELDDAIGTWSRYAEKLDATANEFPREADSRDYCEAAKDLSMWVAIDDWNKFAASIPSFTDLDSDRAKALIRDFARLRDTAGKLQLVAKFTERFEPPIKIFADRDIEATNRGVNAWLTAEWLGEIEYMVTTNTDRPPEERRVFYCLTKPSGNSASFRYVPSIKGEDGEWPPLKIESFNANCKVEISPQKILAEKLETCLKRITNTAGGLAVEEALIEAIKITAGAQTVEPCLRMLTVRSLLMLGEPVSVVLKSDKARNLLDQLDDGNGGVPGFQRDEIGSYISPERDDSIAFIKVRKFSERLVLRTKELVDQMEGQLRELRRTLAAVDAPGYQPVGRLVRDATGGIAFRPVAAAKVIAGDELCIVNSNGEIVVVGKCNAEGRAQVNARSLVAGTPVFVIRMNGEK